MPGPAPKDASTRRRRNKPVGMRTLAATDDPDRYVHLKPHRDGKSWHMETMRRWDAVMRSPMRAEYTKSDMEGLYMLAHLWDAFYCCTNDDRQIRLASEIRQQEQRFGLSPIDRRRLQWEIVRGEEAEQRTREIRRVKAEAATEDVRDLLIG